MIQTLDPTLDLKEANQLIEAFNSLTLPQSEEEVVELLNVIEANLTIAAYNKLKFPKDRKRSFLEILGLPRLESVSSHALAFFMNSNESHQLGDLAVQAILKLSGYPQRHPVHTISVKQEQPAGSGRIDLLIETNDHVIVIENKLFHHANNNPFQDYIQHVVNNKKYDGKEFVYLLLGLKKPNKMPDQFVFISHFDLGKEIKSNIGHKYHDADHHYASNFFDYLNAIETFNENSEFGKMEQAIVDFYRNNREALVSINSNIHYVCDYYEEKIQYIIDDLISNGLDIFEEDKETYYHDTIDNIGAGAYGKDLKTNNGQWLRFWITQTTEKTWFGVERYSKRFTKAEAKTLCETLSEHKIAFVYDDQENEIYLKELSEDISTDHFVQEVAPVISKILAIHEINII